MSSVSSAPGFGASGSVQSTVQKEMRRRKLLVGVFVVLLLVPVGVAVFSLSAAPKSHPAPPLMTAADVLTPQLQVQVKNTDQAVAALQQQVAETKTLAQGNQASLQQLNSSQAEQAQQVQALQGDLRQTQAAVQHTQAVVEQVQALPPPPPANQTVLLQKDVEVLRSQVANLTQQLQQVQRQNAELQNQVRTISRRFQGQPMHPQ